MGGRVKCGAQQTLVFLQQRSTGRADQDRRAGRREMQSSLDGWVWRWPRCPPGSRHSTLTREWRIGSRPTQQSHCATFWNMDRRELSSQQNPTKQIITYRRYADMFYEYKNVQDKIAFTKNWEIKCLLWSLLSYYILVSQGILKYNIILNLNMY